MNYTLQDGGRTDIAVSEETKEVNEVISRG